MVAVILRQMLTMIKFLYLTFICEFHNQQKSVLKIGFVEKIDQCQLNSMHIQHIAIGIVLQTTRIKADSGE